VAVDVALTGLAMPLGEFPGLAKEAEARGYRTAWVGEASGLEAIALSTLIATHTRTLKIANGVIPVQTRTPVVYGQAAVTLAHLAPGRFALGLGLSSEIIVGQWHGLPFAPSIQQMREAVQIIRMTAAGERVNFDGKFYKMKNFRLAVPAPSPAPKIYLAALGPKMCELAGEVADGVLLNWIPPSAVPASIGHVEAGARKAGRSLADVDVAVYVRTCVTGESEEARAALARDVTGYAIVGVYARFFAECGFAEEVVEATVPFLRPQLAAIFDRSKRLRIERFLVGHSARQINMNDALGLGVEKVVFLQLPACFAKLKKVSQC
jgi:probable F420-dependent oxidoreductase